MSSEDERVEPLACPTCARKYPLTERFCAECEMPLVYVGRGEEEPITEAHERARKVKPEFAGGELSRRSHEAGAELARRGQEATGEVGRRMEALERRLAALESALGESRDEVEHSRDDVEHRRDESQGEVEPSAKESGQPKPEAED